MRLGSGLPVTTGIQAGLLITGRRRWREDLALEGGDELLDSSRSKSSAVVETQN